MPRGIFKKKKEEQPQVPTQPQMPPQAQPIQQPMQQQVQQQPQQVQQVQQPVQAEPQPEQPQEQSIHYDRDTLGTILELRQWARRLLEIERQFGSTPQPRVLERSNKWIGSLKSWEELLSEAEDIQLTIDDLTQDLLQKNLTMEQINSFIQGALAGLGGYTSRFIQMGGRK